MIYVQKSVLQQLADALVNEIKTITPKATGKTADSVASHVYEGGFMIDGNASIVTLITGRKPTGAGATKGNPTLQESILEWMDARGIQGEVDKKGKFRSQESISWAIANSIHRKGTILYQSGARSNIFDNILNPQRIDTLVNSLGLGFTQEVSGVIIKELK